MPVKLSGTKQILAALSEFQPEAKKELQKQVRAAAMPIVHVARGYAPSKAPLSGWGKEVGIWASRSYNAAEVRSGIGFSSNPTRPNRSGFSYTSYIYNKSAAGAIYETAGRKNPNGQPPAKRTIAYRNGKIVPAWQSGKNLNTSANPHAGKQFIDSMGKMYIAHRAEGQAGRLGRKLNGRLIYRAWAEDQGKVLGAVVRSYDLIIKQFNGRKL